MRVRQESCVSLTGWVHRYDIALTLEAFVIGVVNLKSVCCRRGNRTKTPHEGGLCEVVR